MLIVEMNSGVIFTIYEGETSIVLDVNDVKLIHADGQEMHHILQNFKSILCFHGKNTMTWYGDIAKTILSNAWHINEPKE